MNRRSILLVHRRRGPLVKRYVVTLDRQERGLLLAISRKGSHHSSKTVNALVMLNCDEGDFYDRRVRGEDIACVLQVSARKMDRLKKR